MKSLGSNKEQRAAAGEKRSQTEIGIKSPKGSKGHFQIESLAWLGGLGLLGSLDFIYEPLGFFRLFFMCFLLFLAKPVAAMFKYARGAVTGGRRQRHAEGDGAEVPPGDEITGDKARNARGTRAYATFLLQGLLGVTINPFGLVQSIAQIGGQSLAFLRLRGRPPYPHTYRQRNRFTLPFRGCWSVVNGGVEPETSHSWELIGQRYAYDFVIVDEEGRSYKGDGSKLEDYYAFGREILAPAEGRVVGVRDGVRDYPGPRPGSGRIDWLTRDFRGNHVVIDHGHGEFSFLTHLKKGSICVQKGQHVQRGQPVGLCGNSGHSTEPHLHFHVQDHPNMFLAASLPVRFSSFRMTQQVSGERLGARPEPGERPKDSGRADPDTAEHRGEGAYITRGRLVEPIAMAQGLASAAGPEAKRPPL